MIVKALRVGFFNGSLRRPGDQFEIPSEEAFSSAWMEIVETGESDSDSDESDDEPVETIRGKRRGR